MLNFTIVTGGRTTSLLSTKKMQIPHMGPEQSQDENLEPHQAHLKKKHQPSWSDQQQQLKFIHGGSILSGAQ